MTPEQFQKKIVKWVDSGGGVSATARRLGVSPTYISQVYNGLKQPSDKLIGLMGYSREIKVTVNYEPQ